MNNDGNKITKGTTITNKMLIPKLGNAITDMPHVSHL